MSAIGLKNQRTYFKNCASINIKLFLKNMKVKPTKNLKLRILVFSVHLFLTTCGNPKIFDPIWQPRCWCDWKMNRYDAAGVVNQSKDDQFVIDS